MSSVPTLLNRAREGDAEAFGEVVSQLYGELRAVARSQRRRLAASETINTTAVVHEAYARLEGAEALPDFADRAHFFRIAARAMRSVIVDYARRQSRQKRGGGDRPLALGDLGPVADPAAFAARLPGLAAAVDGRTLTAAYVPPGDGEGG